MKYNMKVAICLIVKNENRYIREWINYHKKLGVDNIILYDNNDSNGEDIYEVISEDIKSGYVKYKDIKGKLNYQLPCYNECLDEYHTEYDWIIFIDCDEFIELKNKENIKDYLSQEKFENFEQIVIQMFQYGDNDLLKYENKGVIERFPKFTELGVRNTNLFQTKPFYKTTNYVKKQFEKVNFMHCFSTLYNTTCDANGKKILPTIVLFTEDPECIIRHYKTKTIEEFLIRHENDAHFNMNIQLIAKKLKGFFEISNSEKRLKEKIEIIKNKYPWYNHYTNECSPIDFVIVDDGNPLLLYTIKSIKENISWYNKIFVVSNEEIQDKDIILIKSKNIIPDDFENSDIGLHLHNIKDLSERFIYVYSGTIFNYICFEDEFFNGNKICMQPVMFNTIPKKYRKVCYENNKLFLDRKDITCNETFRVSKGNFGYMFSRTCCPMLKSDNKACFDYLDNYLRRYKHEINHLIYPTWSRLMYHNFEYIHTNVSIEECENKLLEIEDPIYKIINVPTKCVDNELIGKIKERYER